MAEKASRSTEELQPVIEGFSGQMNGILNEYVAIYRILLERQRKCIYLSSLIIKLTTFVRKIYNLLYI